MRQLCEGDFHDSLGIRKQENYLETGKPELMTFSPANGKKQSLSISTFKNKKIQKEKRNRKVFLLRFILCFPSFVE
jgi:hypothetical protein